MLTDGVATWIVVEWRVNDFGTTNTRRFQVWLGSGGPQDISFSYDPATVASLPAGQTSWSARRTRPAPVVRACR